MHGVSLRVYGHRMMCPPVSFCWLILGGCGLLLMFQSLRCCCSQEDLMFSIPQLLIFEHLCHILANYKRV